MSIIIGLTGPTGSGKSSLSVLAARMGCFVINCDSSARKAAYKGGPMLSDLVAAFGEDILDSDGELNRKRLAEKAFRNPITTDKLNRVSLPHISGFVRGEIAAAAEDYEAILLDAPTLYESGLDAECDVVIAVLADEKIRLERIMERDSLTIGEATIRMRAAKNEEFYTARTPHILYNNTDLDDFNENASLLLKKVMGGKR